MPPRGADWTAFLEVATSNVAARGLYGRAGFEAVGLRRRYYADGTDALVLRRTLMLPATRPTAAAVPGPV